MHVLLENHDQRGMLYVDDFLALLAGTAFAEQLAASIAGRIPSRHQRTLMDFRLRVASEFQDVRLRLLSAFSEHIVKPRPA